MNSARELALHALVRWRRTQEFADRIAERTFAETPLIPSDRAFALDLFYGVLRNRSLLDFWIEQLRSERLDATTRDILRLGLYQAMLLATPAHAAVFETVKLAPERARKLVNAILRRALREKNSLTEAAQAEPPSVRFSQPRFLIEKWSEQFGERAALELCRWNNQPPQVYARVNRLKTTVADFLRNNPESSVLPENPAFVQLSVPAPALRRGDCYVQDPSTTIACELLRPEANERVLDACAAPGGKSACLSEMMSNKGELVSADRDEMRLERLRANLATLGVTNTRVVLCDWLDEKSIRQSGLLHGYFDKILVDAPCTNTGVMRRRVDVRWRLRPEDFARMARRQLAILRGVVPLLRPGGLLVYSTCSLEPEENGTVVTNFLASGSHFHLTNQRESLPFRDHFDGARAAALAAGE
jgi:16S rRNA (cytosine967-C5)-methyltransferase